MIRGKFEKIKKIVEKELGNDCSAHDIDHIMRVYNLALKIAQGEAGVDAEVLKAAVLLHDIGSIKEANDPTGRTDHAVVGAKMARPILKSLNFSVKKIIRIQECILSHRYRTDNQPQSIEAKILFDADKLDATGAIGLARSFSWVGRHKAKIYTKVGNLKRYIQDNLVGGQLNGRIIDKSQHSTQLNWELKEKFLLKKLYTKTAKKIGQERITYYKKFLSRLEREVKGEL